MPHLPQADGLASLSIHFFGFSAQADGPTAVVCLMLICVAAILIRTRPRRWG